MVHNKVVGDKYSEIPATGISKGANGILVSSEWQEPSYKPGPGRVRGQSETEAERGMVAASVLCNREQLETTKGLQTQEHLNQNRTATVWNAWGRQGEGGI